MKFQQIADVAYSTTNLGYCIRSLADAKSDTVRLRLEAGTVEPVEGNTDVTLSGGRILGWVIMLFGGVRGREERASPIRQKFGT